MKRLTSQLTEKSPDQPNGQNGFSWEGMQENSFCLVNMKDILAWRYVNEQIL